MLAQALFLITVVSTVFLVLDGPDLFREVFGLNSYEIEDPAASRAAADKIISLLEHYKDDTGDYPRTLEELENYFHITVHDVPSGHSEWKYRYVDNAEFVLTFGANDNYYPCEYYESSSKSWSSDF